MRPLDRHDAAKSSWPAQATHIDSRHAARRDFQQKLIPRRIRKWLAMTMRNDDVADAGTHSKSPPQRRHSHPNAQPRAHPGRQARQATFGQMQTEFHARGRCRVRRSIANRLGRRVLLTLRAVRRRPVVQVRRRWLWLAKGSRHLHRSSTMRRARRKPVGRVRLQSRCLSFGLRRTSRRARHLHEWKLYDATLEYSLWLRFLSEHVVLRRVHTRRFRRPAWGSLGATKSRATNCGLDSAAERDRGRNSR